MIFAYDVWPSQSWAIFQTITHVIGGPLPQNPYLEWYQTIPYKAYVVQYILRGLKYDLSEIDKFREDIFANFVYFF